MKALLAVILVSGCELPTTYPWDVRAGIPPQQLTRADFGLDDTADVGIGDMWVSLHDYSSGDVSYPIVGVPGGGLMIESVFDPTLRSSHAQVRTTTRLSQDTEPASDHPDRQFATLFVDVDLVTRLRSHTSGPLANGMATMQLELVIPVPRACEPPPAQVLGSATGCFNGACPDAEPLVPLDAATYQVGSLQLAIEVLDQMCQFAS